MPLFPTVGGITYVPLPFTFRMESTLYVFLLNDVFLPSDHWLLDFDISLLYENCKALSLSARASPLRVLGFVLAMKV